MGVLALCGGWIRDGDGSAVTLALQEASGSSSLASEAAQAPRSCRARAAVLRSGGVLLQASTP